jgi:alpha-amylase
MKSICFYFQVHQPFRLRTYRFFDIGENHYYFDDYRNKYIMKRVAEKCYLPMNQLLLDLISEYGAAFKVSFSISGVALEQFQMYAPEVLESFQRLAATGSVEFLAETYSHSLASLKSKDEFFNQVDIQRKMVKNLFGQDPKTFRNTELIYSDGIGEMVAELGFNTMLTEGAKHVLGWKSPNFMYCNSVNPKLKVLLKNFMLSDDLAFRFSQQSWDGWPLTTEKYVDWLNKIDPAQETINLFMDYETFGEHQWPETGIFEFMKALPGRVFSHSPFKFYTPSELSDILQPVAAIHVPYPMSWADEERDLTAWLGNDLQDDASDRLYEICEKVKNCDDPEIMRDWRYLQTSDHFYYMCTKWFSDGDVHKYFNPYNSPYEAYVNFMNILSDFMIRIEDRCREKHEEIKPEKEKKVAVKKEKPVKKNIPAKPKPKVKTIKAKAPEKKKEVVVKKASPAKKAIKTVKKETTNTALSLISTFSNTTLKNAFKELDAFTIGLALTGADKKIKAKVLANLGIRTLAKLKNMEIKATDFHPREIERCQKKLLDEIKKLKK